MNDANTLFNHLITEYGTKSDAGLARVTGIESTLICKMRKGRSKIGASTILRIHEELGMPVKQIKELCGWEDKHV